MPQHAHTTTDPATGESVSLAELANRYDSPLKRIQKRFTAGKRGWELVEQPDPAKVRSGKVLVARMNERRQIPAERQRIIAELRHNPVNAAMMRPLVRKTG